MNGGDEGLRAEIDRLRAALEAAQADAANARGELSEAKDE